MSDKIASFTATAALSERAITDPSLPKKERNKRVIVTGGSGKLGRWVVKEMAEHGWDVYNREYHSNRTRQLLAKYQSTLLLPTLRRQTMRSDTCTPT